MSGLIRPVSANLANGSDPTKGAALVGDKGATVSAAIALDKRKPRKLFSKLFASASGPAQLKTVILGDSLANVKMQQLTSSLDRRIGGSSKGIVNTAGNSAGAAYSSGVDLAQSSNVLITQETGAYQYWPTGKVSRFDAGASTVYKSYGVNPQFTAIKIYYVKEVGAGTINLVVGGSTVATASANAAVGLGVLTFTQALAQVTVSVTVTGAPVRILMAHSSATTVYGVDAYLAMGVGGLLLANATSSAQGRAIWQAALADIAPDFVTFEMDDAFGDGGANAAAFLLLSGILDAACPYADKLIIASTPRAADDAGKLSASHFLKGVCGSKDASYLFFDSYYLMGSYADMTAIFGADDGVHPNAAAQAYAAEVLWGFLGLSACNLGFVHRAVNDQGTASRLGKGTLISGPLGNMSFETDSFGYDWNIKFPRTLTFSKTSGGEAATWQFSGNTGVFPHVMPLAIDYLTAGGTRRQKLDSSSGHEFTVFEKTDNPSGRMNLFVGLIRSGHTRAELLAMNANAIKGSMAWCTDCTGGAQWVYAKGATTSDWVTVDGKAAI